MDRFVTRANIINPFYLKEAARHMFRGDNNVVACFEVEREKNNLILLSSAELDHILRHGKTFVEYKEILNKYL